MESRTRATMFERLRDGSDPVAWEEFYDRYWRLIFAFARQLGCSEHTSEEVVQDVMLAMSQQRNVFQYDPKKGCFRSWLRTVVRNLVEKHRGRAVERVRASGDDVLAGALDAKADAPPLDAPLEKACEEALLVVLLNVVRQEVTPQAFQAFELAALHGLSGREVAEITGLRRDAVYAARSRVLARRRELGAPYRDEGQLTAQIKQACHGLPNAATAALLAARVEETMRAT